MMISSSCTNSNNTNGENEVHLITFCISQTISLWKPETLLNTILLIYIGKIEQIKIC